MSDTFEKVKSLVAEGDFLISAHGYDELAADDIFLSDVLDSIEGGVVVEDYPSFAKGPCVLVLQGKGQARYTSFGASRLDQKGLPF